MKSLSGCNDAADLLTCTHAVTQNNELSVDAVLWQTTPLWYSEVIRTW